MTTLMFERVAIGPAARASAGAPIASPGADERPGGDARRRGAAPVRRDRRRVPGAALHRLPDADDAPAGPRARARRRRSRRSRRSPRRSPPESCSATCSAPRRCADDRFGELVVRPARAEVGRRDGGDPASMVGERVLGLPPEPRLDKGVPFSELRAKSGGAVMDFALSEEQEFLREAARGTLGRGSTVEAAREALDGDELPDLWPAAVEAGWPGLRCPRSAAAPAWERSRRCWCSPSSAACWPSVPLLGHLPATWLLGTRGGGTASRRSRPARRRAAFVPAQPPAAGEPDWTTEAREREAARGRARAGRRHADRRGAGCGRARGRRARGGTEGGRVAVVDAADAEIEGRCGATTPRGRSAHVSFAAVTPRSRCPTPRPPAPGTWPRRCSPPSRSGAVEALRRGRRSSTPRSATPSAAPRLLPGGQARCWSRCCGGPGERPR